MPVLIIPVLVVAIIAVLCVLLYFAAEQFGHALAQFIPGNLPIIGGKLRSAVDGFASSATSGVRAYAASKIGPFADLIRVPAAALRVHLSTILESHQGLAHISAAIIRLIIPAQMARLAAVFRADLGRVNEYFKLLIAREVAQLRADIAAARAYSDQRLTAASNGLRGEIQRTAGFLEGRIAATVAALRAETAAAAGLLGRRLDGLASTLRSDIAAVDGAINAAESTLRGELHAAEAGLLNTLDTSVNDAIRAVETTVASEAAKPWAVLWPDIEASVHALDGVLGADLPDIGAAVRAIGRDVPVGLLGSIAATSGISLTMLRYLKDCGVPNCRNLGKFGHDLQTLFGAVGDGALLSFLLAAVTDPGGAAEAVTSDVLPTLLGAAGRFEHTIGVR